MKLILLSVLVSSLSWGANLLYFNSPGQASTATASSISYQGTGAYADRLRGQNISVDFIRSVQLPLVEGPGGTSCIGCVLNFDTGISTGTGGGVIRSFDGGGSISVTGGVDFNNNGIIDGADIAAGSTLFSGSFTPGARVQFVDADLRFMGGMFLNTQNPLLSAYYFGVPAGNPWKGVLDFSFDSGGNLASYFASTTINDGWILNEQVPEPSTVLLYSAVTGVLALGAFLRRRYAKS